MIHLLFSFSSASFLPELKWDANANSLQFGFKFGESPNISFICVRCRGQDGRGNNHCLNKKVNFSFPLPIRRHPSFLEFFSRFMRMQMNLQQVVYLFQNRKPMMMSSYESRLQLAFYRLHKNDIFFSLTKTCTSWWSEQLYLPW